MSQGLEVGFRGARIWSSGEWALDSWCWLLIGMWSGRVGNKVNCCILEWTAAGRMNSHYCGNKNWLGLCWQQQKEVRLFTSGDIQTSFRPTYWQILIRSSGRSKYMFGRVPASISWKGCGRVGSKLQDTSLKQQPPQRGLLWALNLKRYTW